MLKCCLNPKVVIGVAVVIALSYFFAPQLLKYSGFLVVLICPLSMLLMMSMMNRSKQVATKLFVCPECGLSYGDAEWAKKCASWCKEHKSCNTDIIKHVVQKNN